MVDSVTYWWHHIPLGDGIVTPGNQGSAGATYLHKLPNILLPEDLTGMKVLDVGCSDGFFSFECERRGASKVIALDVPNSNNEKGFKVVHEILESKVEYIQKDFLTLTQEDFGKFDMVLFLGIFYHLRYPLMGLDILRELTDKLAIIETYCLPDVTEKMIRYIDPCTPTDHHTWQASLSTLEALFGRAGFKFKLCRDGGNRVIYHLT